LSRSNSFMARHQDELRPVRLSVQGSAIESSIIDEQRRRCWERRRMKFSIRLPDPDYEIESDQLATIAIAIESSGLHACAVTDHPFPVLDETRTGHHTLDPFATLSFLAAVTKNIRLHTSLIVLPYRNPFVTANAAMTVDVLSGGRVILGLGTGYLQQEFGALGVDFDRRNELFDEYLSAMRAAWMGEPLFESGSDWIAAGNSLWPLPVSVPHPPLWIGGNTSRAIRRAVVVGNGWSPVINPPDRAKHIHTALIDGMATLSARIALLEIEREKLSREDHLDICVVSAERLLNTTVDRIRKDGDQIIDGIGQLEEMGVTWIAMRPAGQSAAEIIEWINELSSLVINT
jgi:probable F420-dependent oxidoreductase